MKTGEHTTQQDWSVILMDQFGSGQVSRHPLSSEAILHRQDLLASWPGKTYLIQLDDAELRAEILGQGPRYRPLELIDGWIVRDDLTGALMTDSVPDQAEARAQADHLQKLDDLINRK